MCAGATTFVDIATEVAKVADGQGTEVGDFPVEAQALVREASRSMPDLSSTPISRC